MMGALQQLLHIVYDTLVYWGTFLYFWWGQQPISKLEVFGEQRLPLCHVYVLAKTLQLWDAPHYRAASFAEDLRANLKNVAIPGTGIPLSVFCYNKATALFFIIAVNPVISLAAAIYCSCAKQDPAQPSSDYASSSQHASIAASYRQFLLFPDHWFAIWRHNCMLVGYHALVTGSSSYAMEAKGTFLLEGQRLGLPVSPFYSDATVFVKHVSTEGGMGIHVFRNFAQGGEWVVQRALSNSDSLSRMLPPGAPLSTLRVVTASTEWLDQRSGNESSSTPYTAATYGALRQRAATVSSEHFGRGDGWLNGTTVSCSSNGCQVSERLTPDLPLSAGVVQQDRSCSAGEAKQIIQGATAAQANYNAAGQCSSSEQLFDGQVQVVTAVWRAGLAGKDTDHSSICFPVDPQTGVLLRGVSSNHWYKLGLKWLGRLDWSTAGHSWVEHPDSRAPVAGESIPDMQNILRTVMHAHMVATPDVPLVGWDVAVTPEGVHLLEMNLSCNLFNGGFASGDYYLNMFRHFEALESLEAAGRHCGKQP